MKKRILSILLTLCMVLCLMPTAVFAEGSPDITGTGTADDPYLIYTAAGLKEFRDKVNAAERDAHAKLMADIVLNDGSFDENGNYTKGTGGKDAEQWTPISNYYRGTFDGNGKTIRGLYINGLNEHCGLFGLCGSCTIRNLTVTGYVCASANGSVGGIVGFAGPSPYITNCQNSCTVKGGDRVGGIAGAASSNAHISGCSNSGRISGIAAVGGIVGDLWGISVIKNCSNIGAVTGTGDAVSVGGLAGRVFYDSEISNSYSVGALSGSGNQVYVGGIAGETSGGDRITYSCWLEDTAEEAAGDGAAFKNAYARSKFDFADGTVLKLLQNGDTNSPWEKCGYLNAAGMTLPLLSWQTADAHTHNKNGNLGGCDCGQLPAGTADDPYLIYTAEDLKLYRDMVNGGDTGICAKLMNDIVLNDGTFDENGSWSESGTPEQWTPIGDSSNRYAGTFDGGGHTIKGLYVKGAGFAGLFGYINQGTVKNVTVTGYVEGTKFVGGIVGYGRVTTVTGCTNAATVKGGCSYVGGIVGRLYYYNGNVRNCANLGSVWAQIDSDREDARVGGIAGYVQFSATIADCYNAGSIAIQDSGTGKYTVSYLGGIIGRTMVVDYPSYISNCYSVGSLTYRGSASAEIYGITGNAAGCVISNCYWLEGTTESGIGGNPYQTTDITVKTGAEFADGTVLKLLKQNDTTGAWGECGYLAVAGMTLPLLSWQTADAHTHDYQWKYDNTEHWKECSCGLIEQGSNAAHKEVTGICTDGIQCECGYEMHTATGGHSYPADWTAVRPGSTHSKACTNPGCGVTKTESCTGGTATCKEQATCEVCGEKYGTTDPNNHSYEWQNENGQYWQKCKLCDFETDKKLIPTITITGSDRVCRTQDYTFSFTLPEGATDANCGYGFALMGGDVSLTVENGVYSGVVKAEWYDENENSFVLTVYAKTADGFEFSAEKTVAIQNEHSGGTATCTEQATCEICGEKYGDLKPHSYSVDWVTGETSHWHECTECGAKTDEAEHTDTNKDHKCDVCEKVLSECADTNKDHKCDLCGKVLSEHTGGTATCKDKAKCEVCGESYGELNANNHADIKHIEAKAATKTAEGNTEYWYCDGCGKYYKDAKATQEITKAQTVTAKLPDDSKSPQTGDNSNLALWIALLFVSGGVITATTVVSKKKRHS